MTREETAKLLGQIKKSRPNLFKGLESKSVNILDSWSKALAKYQTEEVDELMASGHYIAHYNYTDKVLTDLVKALEEQRNEENEKVKALDRYCKALERYHKVCEKKPVPQTERKPLFDCENCTDKDKQYCSGGICMKMLEGAR